MRVARSQRPRNSRSKSDSRRWKGTTLPWLVLDMAQSPLSLRLGRSMNFVLNLSLTWQPCAPLQRCSVRRCKARRRSSQLSRSANPVAPRMLSEKNRSERQKRHSSHRLPAKTSTKRRPTRRQSLRKSQNLRLKRTLQGYRALMLAAARCSAAREVWAVMFPKRISA